MKVLGGSASMIWVSDMTQEPSFFWSTPVRSIDSPHPLWTAWYRLPNQAYQLAHHQYFAWSCFFGMMLQRQSGPHPSSARRLVQWVRYSGIHDGFYVMTGMRHTSAGSYIVTAIRWEKMWKVNGYGCPFALHKGTKDEHRTRGIWFRLCCQVVQPNDSVSSWCPVRDIWGHSPKRPGLALIKQSVGFVTSA